MTSTNGRDVTHLGTPIRDGAMSALCFKKPQAINPRRSRWTLVEKQVTCAACKAAIEKRGEKR
jgi:hypothetical protein